MEAVFEPQPPLSGTFNGHRVTMQWRLLRPKLRPIQNPQERHPVMLFLHGVGERGDDNKLQLKHVRSFIDETWGPFYILVPQCPAGMRFVETSWFAKRHVMDLNPSPSLDLSMQALELVLAQEPFVDTARVYAAGLSMGGFAIWEAIVRWPGVFAAVVPVCGGADHKELRKLEPDMLPGIWAFHGAHDGTVRPSRSRGPVNALRRALRPGGAVEKRRLRLKIYADKGHSCWTEAFRDPRTPEWLLSYPSRKSLHKQRIVQCGDCIKGKPRCSKSVAARASPIKRMKLRS